MPDLNAPRLSKAPFWIADTTLLVAAAALVTLGGRPLSLWQMGVVVLCVSVGGWLAVLPFLKEYDATVRQRETERLAETAAKLDQLDSLAERIAGATGQWQAIQERATQTAELARGVVERLSREAEDFASVVSRSADGEKQTLKLEVDKLRRGEGDWLQAVGRVMDHVFALHLAAVRSRQPAVVDQIDRFHAACRDALRRVGFVMVVAAPDEPFDPRKHQAVDGARPPEGARINETVAPGFAFQGQLLRPVIVRMTGGGSGDAGQDSTAKTPEIPGPSTSEGPAGPPQAGADSSDRLSSAEALGPVRNSPVHAAPGGLA
jgi:molecular chaperone GrpE (heat shock protein)